MTTYSIMRGGMVFKHLEKDKFLVSNTGEGKDREPVTVKMTVKMLKELLPSAKGKKTELLKLFMDTNIAVPKKLTRPKTYLTEETRKEAVREAKRKYAKKKRGGSISAKDLKGLHASSYKEVPDKEVNGWVLDESISKPTARVYFNASKNQAIVVHRGTEATVKDWANNLAYLTGTNKLTGRYKDAERVQKRAEEKYPDLLTTGHSQGGIYTKIAKDQSKVINVNPASMGETTSGTTIRAKNDPVSALAGFTGLFKKNDKNITTQSKGSLLDAHSIDILDELGDKELGGSLTKYLKMLSKKGKKGKGRFEDFFKKTLPRALVKQGIPIVGSVAGTALGSIAGPISGAVGAEIGSKAGEVLSKYVSDKAGYGMKGGYLGQNPFPRSFGGGMTRHLKSLGK
jgi:hypothetical protein